MPPFTSIKHGHQKHHYSVKTLKNYRDRVIKNLRRKAEEFGFTLQPNHESVSYEGRRVLCQGKPMKYVVIQQHQERFQAHRMCQVFHVLRSGDYEWCRRSESRRSQTDRRLGEKIKAIYKKSRWTYGARRIQTEPCEELILN